MRFVLMLWRDVKAMARSAAGTGLAAAAIWLVVAPGTAGASGIMLDIRGLPLKDVVTLLMQQSGANVVIQDESMLGKKVTVSLNDVPLDKALDYVVKSAGVSYRRMEDGTYIIGGVADEEPVIAKVDLPAVLSAADLPAPPKKKIIVTIPLTHSRPSELLQLLGWSGAEPIRNRDGEYPVYGEHNQAASQNTKGGLYFRDQYGQTQDWTNGVQMQNGQPVVPTVDATSLSRPGAGRAADPYSGAGQLGDQPRGPNFISGPQRATQPANPANPSTTPGTGNFLWPEGIDDVRPFDLDNSIIVKGDQDGIEQFKMIVRMLDVAPKQVSVKAEFVEVRTSDIKAFGIDWSLQRLNESFATAFNPGGNVVVGLATGNLTASLRTQLTSNVGRVINAPIISTINNQMAYINIGRSIPYWQNVTTVLDNNVINNPVVNFLDVQTGLQIMPRVNGDGTITMTLTPQVTDTGNLYTGPDGTTIPEQRTQQLFTQRRVANGETIVVGGFIRKNEQNGYNKIPVLCDLPIIGTLFRTVNKTTEDTETLIFITPTIIPPPGGGTTGEVPIL